MRTLLPCLAALAGLAAADPAPPSPWAPSLRVGLVATNTAADGAETSRDPTIAGTQRSTAWIATLDAGLAWKEGAVEVEQLLKARFGRQKQSGADWVENADEARYDGVLRRIIDEPHFAYAAWGAETVFTGPEPEERVFDPLLARVSVGYGQRYAGILMPGGERSDKAEGRLGVRAQRRFGAVDADDREIDLGLEGFARYDLAVRKDLGVFLQYEAFAPFDDIRNVRNLATAGLSAALAKLAGGLDLRAELAFRAYHECAPRHVEDGEDTGYDGWSLRQDTLVGLTWTY